MKTFTVDWQQPMESAMIETGKNHFKFNPLNICTKDGSNCEMDARIIMEIDDDSSIIKDSGSFPCFVDNMLSVLVRNFFTYKEVAEIALYRLKIQEQFSELAQKKLAEYGVKTTTFTIVYTSLSSSSIARCEEQKAITKRTSSIKDTGNRGNILFIFFGALSLLTVWLSISVIIDRQSVNIDYRFYIIVVIVVPILFFIIIYQHFEIEKLKRMLGEEE